MEWYRLGPLDSPAPPLPGWGRSYGRHASWQPAEPAAVGAATPYLNRAQAVWATGHPESEKAGGEFLFRSRLVVGEKAPVVAARLHLAVRGEVLEVLLNDRPVLTAAEGRDLRCVTEVSSLLKRGANILALRIRNPGAPFVPHPSLAFSLEYMLSGGEPAPSPPTDEQAILHTRNGDRLYGRVITFNPVSILLQTPHGRYSADWERVESVIFPRGWHDPPPDKSPLVRRMIRFFGFDEIAREDASPKAEPRGVRVSASEALSEGGLLLRDGRTIAEELISVEGENIRLRRRESEETLEVARANVAAIFPPRPDRDHLERPAREFATLDCRLKTLRGEIFSGILRQMNADRIVLEHTGDGILTFAPSQIVWVWFPLHQDGSGYTHPGVMRPGETAQARRGASVAILALPSSDDPLDAQSRSLHREVQQAAFLAGLPSEYPTPETMADPERLHVRNYPAVFIADAGGRYPDTIRAAADARAAILSYVETGGTLLVYSERGALIDPLRLQAPEDDSGEGETAPLLRDLGLHLLEPDARGEHKAEAFEHPPNLPVALHMKRHPSMPQGLRSLPQRVEAPDLDSAPFYPVLAEEGPEQDLYQLVNDAGSIFGPVMLAVRRGDGRVIVIDHLLWKSSVQGQAFSQVMLPHLLTWAFRIQR